MIKNLKKHFDPKTFNGNVKMDTKFDFISGKSIGFDVTSGQISHK